MALDTELVRKVKRLSRSEKLALLKVLADALAQPGAPTHKRAAPIYHPGRFAPAKGSSLLRALGALRGEGQPILSDEEAELMRTEYLTEKYG